MRQKPGVTLRMTYVLVILVIVSLIPIGCGGGSGSTDLGFSGGDQGGGGTQATYTVSGQCKSSTGTSLAGCTVELTDSSARFRGVRAFSKTVTADSSGNYTISNVPAGNYQIITSLGGYVSSSFFLEVFNNSTENTFNISTNDWNSFTGSGYPYSASSSYILVNTVSYDQSGTPSPISDVTVTTSPAGQTIGYVNSNSVNWTATSTSSDGKAFIYNLTPGASYTITGLKQSYNFNSVTIAPQAGILYVCDVYSTTQVAKLQTITINPSTANIPVGLSKQLTASGKYNDGSVVDLTDRCTWTSSNPSYGTIGNGDAAGAKGIFYALAQGASKITATLDNISGKAEITVTDASLQSLAVTPSSAFARPTAPQNQVQFHAIGTWSDGTSFDLTSQAQWSTKDPSVSGVGTIDPSTGLFTGQKVGTITVYCTYKSTNSNDVPVTVGTKRVVSVTVSPSAKTVPFGFIQDFTATATYDDGSSGDVTLTSAWTTTDPSVGTIALGKNSAQFTTTGAGTCQVIATLFSDLQSQASVTVLELKSLSVDPPNFTMSTDGSVQISAWGTYEGTSEKYDITRRVQWTATGTCQHGSPVGEVVKDTGYFTSKCTGESVVTCTLPGTTFTGTSTIHCMWGEIEKDGDPFIQDLGIGSDPKIAVAEDFYNVEYYKKTNRTFATVGVSFTTPGETGVTAVDYTVLDVKQGESGFWQRYWTDPETVANGSQSSLIYRGRYDQCLLDNPTPPYSAFKIKTTTPVLAYQDLGKVKVANWGFYNADGTFTAAFYSGGSTAGFHPSIASYKTTSEELYAPDSFGIAFEINSIIDYLYYNVTSELYDTGETGSVASLAYNSIGTAMFTCELGSTEETRQLKFRIRTESTSVVIESASGYRSSLAVSPVSDDILGVAYESSDGSTRIVKYSESKDSGKTWSTGTTLNISTGGWTSPQTTTRTYVDGGIRPALVFSDDGRPSITYATGQGEVRYAYRNSAGVWHVNTCPFGTIDGYPSTEGVCDGPDLEMASSIAEAKGPAVVYVKDGKIVFQYRKTAP
ncbi:MAG: Ig-like domain-containing protein [Vulcanimicrobiota bacterium]